MDVHGKVFTVTGAANGIGRCVALELLRRGGRVAAVDLDEAGLGTVAQEVAAESGSPWIRPPIRSTSGR